MKQIDVVCALILDDRKQLLACKRGPNQSNPDKWEFPGGKIEANETKENALIREIREELQVTIKVISPLPPVTYTYPDFTISLYPFLSVLPVHDEISLAEHSELRWINPKESSPLDMEWAEADIPILNQYIQSL